MYHTSTTNLSGLGLSLKPPKWLRDAVTKATTDIKTKVADEATAAINKARPQPGPQSPVDQVNDAVSAIPGGWLTIALVGVGALILLRPRRG